MDERKIAFLICTNNDLFLEECIFYIDNLVIPEEYSVEVISKNGATSMTSGYNEMMKSSDAKYKIYLHQDTFIINKNFIKDMISIFESDSNIGMIGMVGYKKIAANAVMWKSAERFGANPMYGACEAYKDADFHNNYFSIEEDGVVDVSVADGFLLATSYDLSWDENAFDGWDMYDSDQCFNYLLNGYRVVVPIQRIPWCVHDDGKALTLWNYNKYRKAFLAKYITTEAEKYFETPTEKTKEFEDTLELYDHYREENIANLGRLRTIMDKICEDKDVSCIKEFLEITKSDGFAFAGETQRMILLINTIGKIDRQLKYVDYLNMYLKTVFMLRRIELGYDNSILWFIENGIGYEGIESVLKDGYFEKRIQTADEVCILIAAFFLDYKEYVGAYNWLNLIKNRNEDIGELIEQLRGVVEDMG